MQSILGVSARRFLEAALLGAIGITALTVDIGASKPFRDDKEVLFWLSAGVLSLVLALGTWRKEFALPPTAAVLALLPLLVLSFWRLGSVWGDSSTGEAGVGWSPGVHYLLRQYLLGLATVPFLWAGCNLRLCPSKPPPLAHGLILIAAVLALGVGVEMVGSSLGKEWHPFLRGAFIEAGTQELKTNYFASFGNSNFLAGYLAMLVLVVLGLGWSTARPTARWGLFLLAAVLAIEVLVCRSKGALLGLLSGCGLFAGGLLYGHGRMAWKRIAIGLAVILTGLVVTVVGLSLGERGNRIFGDQWRQVLSLKGESLSQRILLAYTGLELWKESPWVGIGTGQYRLRFLPKVSELLESEEGEVFRSRVEHLKSFRPVNLHNDYLQILVEWGILGYLSFVAFLATLGAIALDRVRNATSSERGIRLGALAGAGAGLGYALFEFPLHLPSHLALMSALLGLAVSGPSGKPARHLLMRTATSFLLIVLGLALLWRGMGSALATRIVAEAKTAVTETKSARMTLTNRLRTASRLDPGNADLDLQLARVEWKLENDPNAAIRTLRKALPIADDPAFRLLEANIAMDRQRWSDAYHALAPLLSVAAYLPGVGYIEGRIEEARGRNGQALEAYERDLAALGNFPEPLWGEIHPDLFRLRLRLGTLLEEAGRYPEAIRQYQALSEMTGDIPLGLLRLGTLYRDRLRDYPTARTFLERAGEDAKKNSTDSEVGRIYQELDRLRVLERETLIQAPELPEN